MRQEVSGLTAEIRSIREALLGNQYDKSGLTQAVADLRSSERSMIDELHDIRADQQRRHNQRRTNKLIAAAIMPVSVALSWLFLTITISDIRHNVGLTPNEARVLGSLVLIGVVAFTAFSVSQFFGHE